MKYSIKELSIIIEDKTGELFEITNLLSENKISLKAINLIKNNNCGILRLLVDDFESAKRILNNNGLSLNILDVFAVSIDNHIGSFNEVVKYLSQNKINLEYTYTINNGKNGAFIFKVEEKDFIKATRILSKSKVTLLQNI